MMKFTVLCLLLCSLQAYGAILGSNKCTWGPSYWCKNVGNANICGAFEHCKLNYWSKPVKSNDVACQLCKDGMLTVDNYLTKNSTKKEVQDALMQICEDIPSEFTNECKILVSENYDMIYDELLSIIGNGDVVCSALGLCSSGKEDQIETLMKKLPTLAMEAIQNDNIPKAVPFLVQGAPMQVKLATQSKVEDDNCQDCQLFIKEVQSVISNNKTIVNDWMQLILSECKALGPGLDEICQQTVGDAVASLADLNGKDCTAAIKTYFPTLLDALMSSDVNSICTTIMMCDFKSKQVVGNDICTDCKNFMADWQDIIMHNKTLINSLTNMILQECQQLGGMEKLNEIVTKLAGFYCLQKPNYLRKQCTRYVAMVIETSLNEIAHECSSLVTDHLPALWQLIADNSPEEICTDIYFCDQEPPEQQDEIVSMEEHDEPDKYCTDCTQFMADLQSVAKNNQSIIDDLTDLVKEECDMLGPEIADLCKKAADQVIPAAVDAITSNDVNVICSTILMCPGGTTHNPEPGNLCNDCIAFTQDWQAIATNDKSIIDEINALIAQQCSVLGPDFEKLNGLLNKVAGLYCNQLPNFLQNKCYSALKVLENKLFSNFTYKCSTLVKDFLPQLWELITENDAKQICSTVYFCDSTPEAVQEVPAPVEEVSSDEYCKDCTQFMVDLQSVAANNQSIIDSITELVKEQCSSLGPGISEVCRLEVPSLIQDNLPKFIALCEKAVDQVIPTIVSTIEDNDVNVICSTMLLCPAGSSNQPKPGNLCNDCVAFTKNWQDIIQNNQSLIDELNSLIAQQCSALGPDFEKLNEVMQRAKAVCQLLPELLQSECFNTLSSEESFIENLIRVNCSSFVKDYLPQLWQMIQYNDAMTICETMSMCNSQTSKLQLPELSVQADIRSAMTLEKATPIEEVNNPGTCVLCKVVVHELDKLLPENKTEEAILSALAKVCELYSNDIQGECEDFIKKYGKEIIDLLIQEVESSTICSKLMLCSSQQPTNHVQVSASELCPVCELVATELDNMLKENSTQAEIIAAVEKVCQILPSSFKSECDQLITMYGEKIISLLDTITPKEICSKLGLCTSSAVKVSDNTACELCELVATELENLLKENSTEKAIVAAIEKVCSVLPSDYKTECDTLIDMYGPLLIQKLLEGLKPDQLCSSIGLCKSTVAIKDSPTIECELCNLFTYMVSTLLNNNMTDQEIIKELENECTKLPKEAQGGCEVVINLYGQKLIDLVKKELQPQVICTQLRLCTEMTVKSVSSDEECTLCQAITTELEKLITKDSTEEEIVKAVKGVCNVLPSTLKSECDTLIDTYGDQIIQLLINKLTPSAICKELKLCTSFIKVSDSTECTICKAVAGELENILKDNNTEAAILSALEKVCTVLPSTIKTECENLVDEYGSQIIAALANDITPSELCTFIKLCSSSIRHVTSDEECTICQAVATELEQLITKDSTEEEIVKAVKGVCNLLPSTLKSECDTLIDTYGDQIIQLLINKLTPSAICKELKLCTSYPKHVTSDEECTICQAVATELEQLITKDSTEEEIVKAVKGVCNLLPSTLKSECDTLIDTYGDQIIQLLINKLTPSAICKELKLCTSYNKASLGDTCELCDIIVQELEHLLEAGKTEEEIEAVLEKVCTILPETYQAECDSFIENYGSTIVELLVNLVPPAKLCSELGLCSGVAVSPVKSTTECDICKLIATELDNLLNENSTKAEIVVVVEKVCDILPGDLKAQCVDFLATNGEALVQLLIQQISPNALCSELKLCSNALVDKSQVASGELCQVCQIAMQWVDQELSANATTEEVEQALENVCSELPSPLKSTCDDLVKQYTPDIIKLLENDLQPDVVCSKIGVCGSSIAHVIIGANPCTYGPSYWCSSEKAARECNAFEHCSRHVWE